MNRKRDLSIGHRLGIGFALLLATMSAIAGAMYYWNQRSAAAEQAFTGRIAPLSEAADRLESALLRVAIGARGYILAPGPARLQRHETNMDTARGELRRLGDLPKQPDGEALYAKLVPEVRSYLSEVSRVIAERRAGAAIDGAAEQALSAERERALSTLQAFSDLQSMKLRDALTAMEAARSTATDGLLFSFIVAVALFLLFAIFTARSIRNPARDLVRVAEALERGDWQPALALAPQRNGEAGKAVVRDEMRKLAHAFGAAAAALERRELRLGADREVASAAGSSLSKETIAASALHAVCSHVRAEVGALYWRENGGDRLTPIALHAIEGAAAQLAVGEGIPGQAARELRTVVARDIPRDSAFSVKLGYDQAPPRCVVAAPVAVRGELIGVLLVASLRELDADAISFLEAAGAQLGIGLQNVKAYEQIQKLLAELGEKSEQVQAQNEELQAQNEELQAQGEEIQAQNEELQAQGEEIQAQNDQLKQQATQLERHASLLTEVDRRKTEFLGILAHELRNPMAAISNSLYALVHAGRNAEVRGRAEQVIDRQTRMLARLVDDLLDVTRIASGKVRLQMETLDMAEVVRECAEDYRDAAEKAGSELKLELPDSELPVQGDRTRLCQIVGNLLDNAIKFGNGRAITVALQALPDRAEAQLVLTDGGIGIEPEVLARLFQPFSQAEVSLARKGGLGLGLALVKALTDLHGGSVHAHSDGLGKGARFVVRLPLARRMAERAKDRSARSPAQSGRPRRILIIEDNADAALTLKDSIEVHGHEVRVAFDVLEGIEIAREFRPDVLLCDIGLPTMDGYQVASRFRSDDGLKSVFLIAVTGYAAPDDQERAARAGFDRHFRKPPDIERLQQILDQLDLR